MALARLCCVSDVSPAFPWPACSATGVGSMPGTDPAEAVAVVLGELPDFPYLPELPARGPGAEQPGPVQDGQLLRRAGHQRHHDLEAPHRRVLTGRPLVATVIARILRAFLRARPRCEKSFRELARLAAA